LVPRVQLALPPSAWSIEGRPASMKSRVENEPVNSTWYWAASCAAGSPDGGGVDERQRQGQPGAPGGGRLRLGGSGLQGRGGGQGVVHAGEPDQLDLLAGQQQVRQGVLAVELVLVEVYRPGDDAAGGQGAVDEAAAVLRLERADQPSHGGTEREHLPGPAGQHAGLDRGERAELVADRAVQGPFRPGRVVG
jgi:hypothetical protein